MTRCIIEFYRDQEEYEAGKPDAMLYQHCDGYPDGILPDLDKLSKAVTNVPRYGDRHTDPGWCAAEYIQMFRTKSEGHIYVMAERNIDVDFLYKVVGRENEFDIHVFKSTEDRYVEMSKAEIEEYC